MLQYAQRKEVEGPADGVRSTKQNHQIITQTCTVFPAGSKLCGTPPPPASLHKESVTFGGSVVILMPCWRMEMGKSGWGEELSHSLKSGLGLEVCSCSTSLSSCGIQLSDRWQLARNTQFPCKQQQDHVAWQPETASNSSGNDENTWNTSTSYQARSCSVKQLRER